jgi:hypothetical protein
MAYTNLNEPRASPINESGQMKLNGGADDDSLRLFFMKGLSTDEPRVRRHRK